MFELMKRRKHSCLTIKKLGFTLSKHKQTRCHRCNEVVYSIQGPPEVKTAPSGERFAWLSWPPLGYLCARCQAVGSWSDVAGDLIHVDKWLPGQTPIEQTLRPVRPKPGAGVP